MRNIQANLELIFISLAFSLLTIMNFLFLTFLNIQFIEFSGWPAYFLSIFLFGIILFYNKIVINKYYERFLHHIENSSSLKNLMDINWHNSKFSKKYIPIIVYTIFSILLMFFFFDHDNLSEIA